MTGFDLSSLNDAERRVLLLLAEGHTAKSIATISGGSVGAVNERLREARRKTGVGSSRELARLFAQESRDKEIGVARAMPSPRGEEPAGANRSGQLVTKGLLAMLFVAIVAAMILSTQNHAQRSDPDVDKIVSRSSDSPSDFRDRFLSETRDESWATATERAARARYAAIPGLAHDASLRVECASTICQVSGHSVPGGGEAGQNKALGALQSTALIADFGRLGLQSKAVAVRGAGTKAVPGFAFVSYWCRRG
jgi:DNA-binding CsgD family transcriptional regulator